MTWDPEWLCDNLAMIIGATITGVFMCPDREFGGFACTRDGKDYDVWINSDSEGNRCGSVSIHEVNERGEQGPQLLPERTES